jgi:hypothetical protein
MVTAFMRPAGNVNLWSDSPAAGQPPLAVPEYQTSQHHGDGQVCGTSSMNELVYDRGKHPGEARPWRGCCCRAGRLQIRVAPQARPQCIVSSAHLQLDSQLNRIQQAAAGSEQLDARPRKQSSIQVVWVSAIASVVRRHDGAGMAPSGRTRTRRYRLNRDPRPQSGPVRFLSVLHTPPSTFPLQTLTRSKGYGPVS